MHRFLLSVTRAAIRLATDLHLLALAQSVQAKVAAYSRAQRRHDDAIQVVTAAQARRAEARKIETEAKYALRNHRNAAQAEADLLRPGVSL